MANWLAGIATAVAKAATTAASNKSGSSSSPSSSSSGGSSGGSSGSYTYKDSDGGNRTSNDNYDYASAYNQAKASGNNAAAQYYFDQRSNKLGGTDSWDSWQRNAYQDLQGIQAQQNQYQQPAQTAVNDYINAQNQYMQDYERQQAAIRAEQEAKVNQNIAQLNAQKDPVMQAGAQSNTAAQQNYMNVLNPNGANAEQLAALGLSSSGLSEDAAIRANNAFTQAVNSNEQNVNNQMNAIELAITNARLSGDLATAQRMQEYYDNVLNAGMQNANNVLSAQQWAINNNQNQGQQAIDNAFTQAGMTGTLNGQQTMAGQQLSYTIKGMDLDNQIKQYQLLLQKTFGMDSAAADLEARRLANQGAAAGNAGQLLENEYQKIYNQYARKIL